MAILEINDCDIRLIDNREVLVDSPGYITIEKTRHHSGRDARARVKLNPTSTEFRFWNLLGTQSLEMKNKVAATQADLAYLHLKDVWSRAPAGIRKVLLSVPADYSTEQLRLLLGMAQSLSIPVAAMADTAMLAAPGPVPGQTLIHLDLHQHRCVLSRFEQSEWLQSSVVHGFNSFSLTRCCDRYLHAISTLFIARTRFDPMHDAVTEQQLFDQLDGIWSGQTRSVKLRHQSGNYELKVDRNAVQKECASMFTPLIDEINRFYRQTGLTSEVTLLLDHRFRRIPGVMQALAQLPNTHLVMLDEHALESGRSRLYLPRENDSHTTTRVTKLPWFSSQDKDSHQQTTDTGRSDSPTHVLYHARAYGLNGSEFVISSDGAASPGDLTIPHLDLGEEKCISLRRVDDSIEVEAGRATTLLLNERAVSGRVTLNTGDRLRLGEHGPEISLIVVEASHGS